MNKANEFIAHLEQKYGRGPNRADRKTMHALATIIVKKMAANTYPAYLKILPAARRKAVQTMADDYAEFIKAKRDELSVEERSAAADLVQKLRTLSAPQARQLLATAEKENPHLADVIAELWAGVEAERAVSSQHRTRKTKNKVGTGDPSVMHYLEFVESLARGIKGEGYSNHGTNDLYKTLDWAQACKIIEVPPSMYVELAEGIDRYTTEVVAGLSFQPASLKSVRGPGGKMVTEAFYPYTPPSAEEVTHLATSVSAAGHKMGWPDAWPFAHTWLAFGTGIWLAPHQLKLRMPAQEAQAYTRGTLVGLMIMRAGQCVEVIRLAKQIQTDDPLGPGGRGFPAPDPDKDWEEAWQLVPQYQSGRWLNPYIALSPWMVHALSAVIQDHRTVVLEHERAGMSYKRECVKAQKVFKWPFTPRPFYRIQLQQKVEWESRVRKQFAAPAVMERNHRWDVREHERVRVRRGPLPLPEKTKRELLRRRPASGQCYRVYEGTALEGDDTHRLSLRGFPKYEPEKEWIAVLVSVVGEHCKGPADKPYVPGKRVLDPKTLSEGLS
jgi:hypothetical protein